MVTSHTLAPGHRSLSSVACRLLRSAFRGWCQAADKLCQQTLADGYEEVAGQVGSIKAENDRLRRDNERFVRLIDSGEWGRGRVAELTQAGECLMQPCVRVGPCFLVCQLKLCAEWMEWFCPARASMEALYTMDGLVLSSTCVNQSSVHNAWIGVVNTRAGAPSRGRPLALAGMYSNTGNHWGMPCTLG